MSFIIDEMDEFSIVGFIKKIPLGLGNIMCPLFWNELNENYFSKLDDNSEISKYIKEHNIGEFAVCIDEMEKDHFISFVAWASFDRVMIVRLYPEQNAELHMYLPLKGDLYVFCNKDGLFHRKL